MARLTLFPGNPAAVAGARPRSFNGAGGTYQGYIPGPGALGQRKANRGRNTVNQGRRLPSSMAIAGAGRRSLFGGGGGMPAPTAIPMSLYGGTNGAMPSMVGGNFGFPIGSVNLKPSKFSGGFSNIVRTDTQNRRTGSMADIDRRRSMEAIARVEAMNANAAPVKYRRSSGEAPDWRGAAGRGGTNADAMPGKGEAFPPQMIGLFQQLQQAQNDANDANRIRYDDIATGYRQRELLGMHEIDKLGQTQRRTIDDSHTQSVAQAEQDLTSRGLGNSTLRGSHMNDLGAVKGRLYQDLDERLARQKADLRSDLRGDLLGFMERKTDAGPDMGMYGNMLTQLGESGFEDWGSLAPFLPGYQPPAPPQAPPGAIPFGDDVLGAPRGPFANRGRMPRRPLYGAA